MKLEEYLHQNNLTQKRFAELVGVTYGHIGHILKGIRSPSLMLAKHIEETTGGAVTVYDLIDPNAPNRFKVKRDGKDKKIRG